MSLDVFSRLNLILLVSNALKPKFIVPGSAAFRYRDELDFLNRYSFPTTPQQFLTDLEEFCPDIKTSTFNSGDIAFISKEGVRIDQQSSDFVRILDDDSDRIIFKPVMEVTPIRSRVSDSETNGNEMQTVEDYIEGSYIDLLSASDKLD